MPSFQRGTAPPRRRRRRGTALPLRLRGAAFPLCRSILMRGLHLKGRRFSRHRMQNCARSLFRQLISTELRCSDDELSGLLEICLASQAPQIPGALRWLFIFDTGAEKREDLSTFVEDNWRLGTSTDPGRDPTAAVVEWLTSLHLLGFSLSGNFSITDFALDHSELLRGKRKLFKNLRNLTRKRRRRDMESCANMIEFGFYNRGFRFGNVPYEIKHLVWLLKNFKLRYWFLIRFHACHENEERKVALLEIMYARLRVLEKIDKPKYNRIMKELQCCPTFLKWTNIDMGAYLIEVLEEQRQSGYEITDPETLVELQKAMDDEGEFAGLGWHRPNLAVQLIHDD